MDNIDMGEIEAALTDYADEVEFACFAPLNTPDECKEKRAKLLALIREKLAAASVQKPTNPVTISSSDAEHEAKVEAWRKEALEVSADDRDGEIIPKPEDVGTPHEWFCLRRDEIDEALRLMRARPAATLTGKLLDNMVRTVEADKAFESAAGKLLRVLMKAAPHFQSYEECDSDYCKTAHDHPIRQEIDEAIEEANRAGIRP